MKAEKKIYERLKAISQGHETHLLLQSEGDDDISYDLGRHDLSRQKTIKQNIFYLAQVYLNDPKFCKNLRSIEIKHPVFTPFLEIFNLTNDLEEIKITGVHCSEIPIGVFNQTKLKNLVLSYNNIEKIPASIENLTNLIYFDIRCNKLAHISPRINNLHQLEYLNISENRLESLPPTINFPNLKTLYLNSNWLSSLNTEIENLNSLVILDINSNRLKHFLINLDNASNITHINLNNNALTEVPEVLLSLTNLMSVDLSFNKIVTIPSEIINLIYLFTIDLRHNNIERIPKEFVSVRFKFLKNIYLDENPNVIFPPLELLQLNGPYGNLDLVSFHAYLRGFSDTKETKISEVKLMFVGNGRVGKTSIIKRLVYNDFDPMEEITHGINIEKLIINSNSNSQICCNIWDFGGQEIYHATHRFFLSSNALYVLIWDSETRMKAENDHSSSENFSFYYWLNNIKILTDNSPVLMVKNKIDKNDDEHTINFSEINNQIELKKQFNIVEFLNVSASTGKNITSLHESISDLVLKDTRIHKFVEYIIPESWLIAKDELLLLKKTKNYISIEEYFALCENTGIDENNSLLLSSFLHETGVILHFYDSDRLWDIVILNPNWVTSLAYLILDKVVINKNGIFDIKTVEGLWSTTKKKSEIRKESQLLINIMKKFELLFEQLFDDKIIYIAPQLLPSTPPENATKYLLEFAGSYFFYEYEILHKGIISRLIVSLSNLALNNMYWKNGIIIGDGDSIAVINCIPFRNVIIVKLIGNSKEDLLSIIRRKINRINKNLNPIEKISCICENCKNSDAPFLFPFKKLKELYDLNLQSTVSCPVSYKNVYLSELIGNIGQANKGHAQFLKDLIIKDQITEAIDELLKISQSKHMLSIENDLIIQRNRFIEITNSYNKGLIEYSDYLRDKTMIITAVLSLADKVNI